MSSGTMSGETKRRPRLPRRLPGHATLRPLDDAGRAPLMSHVQELRLRVTLVAVFFVAAFAGAYTARDWLFEVLARPLDGRWPLQTLGVTEPFFTSLSVAAQAAFVVTLPVLVWHAWRFARPAIPEHARRAIGGLLIAAPALFACGVSFGYFLVLGPAVQFLLGLGPDSIDVVVRANDYYGFVSTTLLAIGAVFCFPLLLLGLARLGVVTSAKLRAHRRIAIVLIVVIAALLPTADPVSLAIEMVPLVLLYELSILAVRVQERMVARKDRVNTNEPVPKAHA